MVPASGEDHWLQVGAIEKARSIVALAGGSTADRILEVGAGSGAILRELDRLKFGRQYWACEPSQQLYEQLMRANIGRLVEAHPTTLEDSPMVDNHFDLVVLSHVLEHVVAPGQLLARCLALAPRVVLEVPLEGSIVARFRATLIRRRRWPNAAGHIHFFSQRSTHELVSHAGGQSSAAARTSPWRLTSIRRPTQFGAQSSEWLESLRRLDASIMRIWLFL